MSTAAERTRNKRRHCITSSHVFFDPIYPSIIQIVMDWLMLDNWWPSSIHFSVLRPVIEGPKREFCIQCSPYCQGNVRQVWTNSAPKRKNIRSFPTVITRKIVYDAFRVEAIRMPMSNQKVVQRHATVYDLKCYKIRRIKGERQTSIRTTVQPLSSHERVQNSIAQAKTKKHYSVNWIPTTSRSLWWWWGWRRRRRRV